MPRGRPQTLIGPRRASGAFYKKRPAPKKKLTTKGAKLTKPVKSAIQRMIYGAQETKYVVAGLVNANVYNTCRTKLVPAGVTTFNYLRTAMPTIVNSGTQTNDLIGAKCKIMSLKTVFHFNLDTANAVSQDIMVKVFFLQSRNVKNYSVAFNGLTGGNLLRTGNAGEEDWVPATGVDSRFLNQLPINKLSWTGTSKTFRLSKNGGTLNNQTTGAVPVLGNGIASYDFTHNWKANGKTLRYDEGDGSNYPENYLPLIGIVAWYPDGTPVGAQDTVMPVNVTFSSHLWYKDS